MHSLHRVVVVVVESLLVEISWVMTVMMTSTVKPNSRRTLSIPSKAYIIIDVVQRI